MLKKVLVTFLSFLITMFFILYANYRQNELMKLAEVCSHKYNLEENGLTERNMEGYYRCLGDDRDIYPHP